MLKNLINKSIKAHIKALNLLEIDAIEKSINLLIRAIENDGTIFWCGNGGSASQANHLSAELVGGMYKEKISPFKSICLNVDTSFITAWSNDFNYNDIFVRQINSLGSSGKDVLVCLSTSGNSGNIVNAAKYCSKNGIKVLSLTGNNGGELKKFSDINLNIEIDCTQRIQEIHILIGHILCSSIENHFKSLSGSL